MRTRTGDRPSGSFWANPVARTLAPLPARSGGEPPPPTHSATSLPALLFFRLPVQRPLWLCVRSGEKGPGGILVPSTRPARRSPASPLRAGSRPVVAWPPTAVRGCRERFASPGGRAFRTRIPVRLPSSDALCSARIRYGRYLARRLLQARFVALAADVEHATAGVKQAGRALKDAEEPIQDVMADRDGFDGDLAAQSERSAVAGRSARRSTHRAARVAVRQGHRFLCRRTPRPAECTVSQAHRTQRGAPAHRRQAPGRHRSRP